jgi:hypothetical protein
LVSGRHTKTIYKISGADGSIIWQLGGKSSDFELNYQFNFQHYARFRGVSGSVTTISLFDNGSDDSGPPSGQTKDGYEPYSSGLVVEIDVVTRKSRLVQSYISPEMQSSHSMGNLQLLPNGNWFMGGGAVPVAVEFTNNSTGIGQVAFLGHLVWDTPHAAPSYRNFKFPWSAIPAAAPDVFAYALNCTSDTVVYISWNGATEVSSWGIWTGSAHDGQFINIATISKTGFETSTTILGFSPYLYAQAIDRSGNILRTSGIITTFVPSVELEVQCDVKSCPVGMNYNEAPTSTCLGLIEPTSLVISKPKLKVPSVHNRQGWRA